MLMMCFILITSLNSKGEDAKMVIPVHTITVVKKFGNDKNYSIKLNNDFFEVKESPEEIMLLIKKECK